jgi:hypothetical protein
MLRDGRDQMRTGPGEARFGDRAGSDNRFAFKHEDFPALGADHKKQNQPVGQVASHVFQQPGMMVGPLTTPCESQGFTLLDESHPGLYSLEEDPSRDMEAKVDNEIKNRFGHLSQDLRQSLKEKFMKERLEASKAQVEQTSSSEHRTAVPHRREVSKDLEEYGLLGLLRVIRMTEPDLNMLALGVDLTKLGLNLNSPEYLSQSFGSPWLDQPMRASSEPEYWLPAQYYVHPTPIKNAHFGRFTVDTVFYVFHNMPGDLLQTYAATELCLRGWRYHIDLQVWFRAVEDVTGRPEVRGSQWIFFDPVAWEKRFYTKAVDKARFLAPEECRVKGNPANHVIPTSIAHAYT